MSRPCKKCINGAILNQPNLWQCRLLLIKKLKRIQMQYHLCPWPSTCQLTALHIPNHTTSSVHPTKSSVKVSTCLTLTHLLFQSILTISFIESSTFTTQHSAHHPCIKGLFSAHTSLLLLLYYPAFNVQSLTNLPTLIDINRLNIVCLAFTFKIGRISLARRYLYQVSSTLISAIKQKKISHRKCSTSYLFTITTANTIQKPSYNHPHYINTLNLHYVNHVHTKVNHAKLIVESDSSNAISWVADASGGGSFNML